MKSCITCGYCYGSYMDDTYKCLIDNREDIKDVYLLHRVVCDDYVPYVLNIGGKDSEKDNKLTPKKGY